jgi:hypothetical protein
MVEDSGADRGGVAAVAWELTGAVTMRWLAGKEGGDVVVSCAVYSGCGGWRTGEAAPTAYWSGHQDLAMDKMNGRGLLL